jgi:predicted nucleic acid-binding protein
MAKTDLAPVVSDAGPVIHLDEAGCLDLLADFTSVLVPRQVWDEVLKHRAHLANRAMGWLVVLECAENLSPRLKTLADSLGLGVGERAALTLMEAEGGRLLLCDDAAARLAAESAGFEVRGSVGIIVRAMRRGLRTREQVLMVLRSLPQLSTLHISPTLLASIIRDIERG